MTLTPMQGLTRAITLMVSRDDDVVDVVATLLEDAKESIGAAAGALLATSAGGPLELLAATSHREPDLALYHAQEKEGPCPDAVASKSTVVQDDGPDLAARWPELAEKFHAAGYRAVQAHPLRWRNQALGAVSFFHRKSCVTADDLVLGQAFADVGTMLLLTPTEPTGTFVAARIGAAFDGRTLIEQAKGVLAYRGGISGEAAYAALLCRTRERGMTLTQTAAHVLESAHRA